MEAHQAPPSLGFSRQEHWSVLPFLSPMHEVKSESEVAQSCLTLSDPMDCSPPGSSVHGIFQERVLEWGAIAFSIFHFLGHHWSSPSRLICLYITEIISRKITCSIIFCYFCFLVPNLQRMECLFAALEKSFHSANKTDVTKMTEF